MASAARVRIPINCVFGGISGTGARWMGRAATRAPAVGEPKLVCYKIISVLNAIFLISSQLLLWI
jgi:hypothetical protein